MLPADVERLVHELQVHQIELEMQNEELKRAQAEIAESREKYVDLYDFAPVGYFSFDQNGIITEMNLPAASLVGIERTLGIGSPSLFYQPPDQGYLFRTSSQGAEDLAGGKGGLAHPAQRPFSGSRINGKYAHTTQGT